MRTHVRKQSIPLVLALGIVISASPIRLAGQARPVTQPTTALPAFVAGVLAGAGGFVLGGIIGANSVCSGGSCEDFEAIGGAVIGAAIGEALLLPIGVHLGNRSAGSPEQDLLVSLGVGGAALFVAAATESSGLLLAGVIAQVGLTVWTERRTGRSRGMLQNANLLVQPSRSGDVLIGLSLR